MPKAPPTHRPAHYVAPSVRRKEHDQRRLSASERGYDAAWSAYSEQLTREILFCELCITIGKETPIARAPRERRTPGERQRPISYVDHIIPVESKEDPLFWERSNHWCLCSACNGWKLRQFDGGWGAKVVVATDRTLAGVQQRRAMVVEAFRAASR
jgi:5-methylcytosine-specific restriction endonuclease McrA